MRAPGQWIASLCRVTTASTRRARAVAKTRNAIVIGKGVRGGCDPKMNHGDPPKTTIASTVIAR